jgi:hypothetical protein
VVELANLTLYRQRVILGKRGRLLDAIMVSMTHAHPRLPIAIALLAGSTLVAVPAARGARPSALDRHGIPSGGVAQRSSTEGILAFRALPAGRLVGLGATTALQHGLPGAQATRPRTFWTGLLETDFAVPAGADAGDLLFEMNDLLGSVDPVRWIYRERRLTPAQQRRLLELWTGNLSSGLGERGTDTVFRRSFSALHLSLLAALDLQAPFLTQAEFDGFLDSMLSYLDREVDRRGYDETKGWIHAVAHGADVLKFMARNPKLPQAAHGRLVDAVARACAGADVVFTWGEDDRLSAILVSLVRRPDADLGALERWLSSLPAERERLWADGVRIDPAQHRKVRNSTLVLRSLLAALSLEAEPGPGVERARRQTLGALRLLQ